MIKKMCTRLEIGKTKFIEEILFRLTALQNEASSVLVNGKYIAEVLLNGGKLY